MVSVDAAEPMTPAVASLEPLVPARWLLQLHLDWPEMGISSEEVKNYD
jgi:hypothetical protein